MATPSKITQGKDNTERLYTVRPRTSSSVTSKRGTPSSIRFKLPDALKNDLTPYTASKKLNSAEAQALAEAANTSSGSLGFINFIAQSVSYSIQEKSQIMHTFGGSEAVYFYGKAPVMVQISGTIVDDIDNDQFAKFLGLYNKFLRGSEAAKEYAYVTLSLNNAIFNGVFLNISIQQDSARDTDITFSAQFLAKNFTLASSDTVFGDTGGKFTSYLKVRDPDPTLTRENVAAIILANQRAAALSTSAGIDPSNGATLSTSTAGAFGDWSKTFGSLPSLSDSLISAATITNFFDGIASGLNELISPVSNLLGGIDSFAQDAIGIMEAVEGGLDDILKEIDSITKQVYGTKQSLDEAYTKFNNFPLSLSSKISHLGKPGGSPLAVIGSSSISSSDAVSLLYAGSGKGAARGTPEGASAALALSNTTSQAASLTPDRDTSISNVSLSSQSLITLGG